MPDIALRFGKDMLAIEGDMADLLRAQDIPEDACAEVTNVLDPELVQHAYQLFRLAQVPCSVTNTYGASRASLANHGLGDRVEEINAAGVRLAVKCSPQHVLAVMGPCALRMAPGGHFTFEQVFSQYFEQANALAEGKPDAILIEDMTNIAEARAATLAVHYACGLPSLVCCSFNADGVMPISQTTPEAAAVILEAAGAAAVGLNATEPMQALPVFKRLATATNLPLIAYVDAGVPQNRAGKAVYPNTPDSMADIALRYRQAGAQLFGVRHGGTYSCSGAVASVLEGLDVVPHHVSYSGVLAATERELEPLPKGTPLSLLEFSDGTSFPADKPLLLRCGNDSVLEKALRSYPGRPVVDLRGLDVEAMTDQLVLARQYGAIAAFPLGTDLPITRLEAADFGLEGRNVAFIQDDRIV